MKILRWLVFLPVGAVCIALAQFVVALIAENLMWWVGAPMILFFGAVIAMASMVPSRIAPDPKVGATVLLTLFALFEVFALVSFLPKATIFPAIARLYADVVLVIGGVAAASIRNDASSE